jgi:hypothetical protein
MAALPTQLSETARLYRKPLWRDGDDYIEIWCEKDALAGVIYPVVYDVPLMDGPATITAWARRVSISPVSRLMIRWISSSASDGFEK